MNIGLLNIYRTGLKVERLHTIPHIQPYNNGFHSANAALIARQLAELNNHGTKSLYRIITWMLLHDVHEGYIGDIPANVKVDHPMFKSQLSEIECKWEDENIDLPDLMVEEKDICKAADMIELSFYCLDELNMGNRGVIVVLKNIIQYMHDYHNVLGVSECCSYIISEAIRLTGENIINE